MDNPLRTARATVCHINLARGYRGGERQTELLIRALADKGWKQRLVARRSEPLAERICGVDGLTVVESSPASAVRSIGRPGLIRRVRLFRLPPGSTRNAEISTMRSGETDKVTSPA